MSSLNRTRRRFFRDCSALAVTSAATGSLLGTLGAASANANVGGDYRALVCILLAGGADSFNMLVPNDDAGYREYANVRADLALPRDTLAPLAGVHQGGRRFALHPGLASLAPLFSAGDLGFVANAGPLVAPTTLAEIQAGTARLPLGLYSHSDQIATWQTSVPDARITTGVAGRMADLLVGVDPEAPVSLNISVSGTNVFQAGTVRAEYTVDARSQRATEVAGYGDPNGNNALTTRAIDAMLSANRRHLITRAYAGKLRAALDAGSAFNAALAVSPTVSTAFPTSEFGTALGTIARVIAARQALNATRQTFFVQFGGWDHHDDVIENQARMLPVVAAGLVALRDALVELGVFDCVTTFTISDFGRTLTSNGKGSDHGWGGNQIVLGGAVNGGQIHGTFPELAAGNALDTGRGRFIPTTAVDVVYHDLARWFGIAASDVRLILPNIGRFHDTAAGSATGLLAS